MTQAFRLIDEKGAAITVSAAAAVELSEIQVREQVLITSIMELCTALKLATARSEKCDSEVQRKVRQYLNADDQFKKLIEERFQARE